MSTKEVIGSYFRDLKEKKSWESFLAEEMIFTSFVIPSKQVTGRNAYIESTKRFFSMIVDVQVRETIIEGEKACVLTRYQLQPPKGNGFSSDVAEVFVVRGGKIVSLAIYFDSSPFPK